MTRSDSWARLITETRVALGSVEDTRPGGTAGYKRLQKPGIKGWGLRRGLGQLRVG